MFRRIREPCSFINSVCAERKVRGKSSDPADLLLLEFTLIPDVNLTDPLLKKQLVIK